MERFAYLAILLLFVVAVISWPSIFGSKIFDPRFTRVAIDKSRSRCSAEVYPIVEKFALSDAEAATSTCARAAMESSSWICSNSRIQTRSPISTASVFGT